MARRSPRIQELREKNELSCTWGLFSILESCQGRPSCKLISNGRPVNKHIIDYPRKVDHLASFDEECRKIQNEAGLRSVAVDAKAWSVGNSVQEDMSINKHRSKQNIVQRREQAKLDSELDCLVKTQKRSGKCKKASQSSSCLNNVASLNLQLPSTSTEISLNKLTPAAILEAVCVNNHSEESKLSEYFQRSRHLGKYDKVEQINLQQVQMRAKAFVDQIFIDKNFRTSSESNSFSNSLEVLNLNKDIVRRITHSHASQTEKGTANSVLDDKFSECEGLDASSSAEAGIAFVMHTGKMDKNLVQKSNNQCQFSRKTNFASQPSDKIVILKPAPKDAKHSNVTCQCSSLQSHNKLGRRVSNAKTTSFSFREMKKKLKHTFAVTRKESRQFLTVDPSDKLSQERWTVSVGDKCTCRGVNIKNSFHSSNNAKQMGIPWKKQGLKSARGSDVALLTDTARKKLDFSSVGISNKQEFDAILEEKRHLSASLNNLNSVEVVTSKKSPKTLSRILSSPEHDFWTLSPRRDSQYCFGSAQMRFNPHSTSSRVINSSTKVSHGKERVCLGPSKSNTDITLCDDHNKCNSTMQIMNTKTFSPIPSIEEEMRDTDISAKDNMKSSGESNILEISCILQPELQISEEVPSEIKNTNITRTAQITEAIKTQEDDEILKSTLDSENEETTSTAEDFPSTSSSTHQLDTADSIKYQEEHQSPVSVLEPFFIEDADSPPSIMLQTAGKQLQPLRLDFGECLFESLPHDPYISANSCIEEEDHLSQYVQLVLEASFLSWDLLSEIRSPPEELLHASVFDEVELPPAGCYYSPKLLFDHINEVLLEIYKYHFCSPHWLAFAKPKLMSAPLVELVLDEMIKEADYYLLPTTEKRTLDQLVSKDVAKCRSWLDLRLDTEQIVIGISEGLLEELILDLVLEFHT